MEKPDQKPRPTPAVHWLDAVLERLGNGEELYMVFGALPVKETTEQIVAKTF